MGIKRYLMITRGNKYYLVEEHKSFFRKVRWFIYIDNKKHNIHLLLPYQGLSYTMFSTKWLKHGTVDRLENYPKNELFHVNAEKFKDRFVVASKSSKLLNARSRFVSVRIREFREFD